MIQKRIDESSTHELQMFTNEHLNDYHFFKKFTSNDLEILSNYFQLETFPKNHSILTQGKMGDKLYIVKSGTGKIYVKKPGNIQKFVANTEIGNCYGEVSMLAGDIITASIVTEEEMECYTLTREKLISLRYTYSDLAWQVEEAIANSAIEKIEKTLVFAEKFYAKTEKASFPFPINTLKPLIPTQKPYQKTIKEDLQSFSCVFDNPLFRTLSTQDKELLLSISEHITVEKDSQIQLKNGDGISIVCQGMLQIYTESLPKVSFIEPGKFLGNIPYIAKKNFFSAFAREKTILIKISSNELDKLYTNHRTIWIELHKMMCSQVVQLVYAIDRLILRLESTKQQSLEGCNV